jgi:hypothetical protein
MKTLPTYDTSEWLGVESEVGFNLKRYLKKVGFKKIFKKKGDFSFGFTVLEFYTSRKRPARRSCIMITGR